MQRPMWSPLELDCRLFRKANQLPFQVGVCLFSTAEQRAQDSPAKSPRLSKHSACKVDNSTRLSSTESIANRREALAISES